MKYSEVRVFLYSLPIQGLSFSERKGLLLQTTYAGKELWSEVSPLPGFSKETLQEVAHFLQNDLFFSLENIASFPHSLQFGIECLQAQIHEEREKTKKVAPSKVTPFPSVEDPLLAHMTSPSSPSIENFFPQERILLNGHLTGNRKDIEKRLSQILEQGYKTAKLKLHSLPHEEAVSLIKDIKGSIKLRLDVNRGWSLDEALSFCSHFSEGDFEYIEEPLQNFADLKHFPFPIALDESLREIKLEDLHALPNLEACIIKPTLHGRFALYEPIYNFCKEKSKKVILTSCFESGVGHIQIAKLAKKLSLSQSMGLDTYHYLREDVLQNTLLIENGHLHIPESLSVNKKKLKEIARVLW